jgi:hypothetical protein
MTRETRNVRPDSALRRTRIRIGMSRKGEFSVIRRLSPAVTSSQTLLGFR